MKRYMLDTNTVSHLLRDHTKVVQRVVGKPVAALCISVITEAELLFGLERRPEAKRLHRLIKEFLARVDALPWDSNVAQRYGAVRAAMEHQGKLLAPLGLLIGAHALAVDAVLVTNDRAFAKIPGLRTEDWTR